MKRADRQPLFPPPWHRPQRRQAGATTRSCIGNRQLYSLISVLPCSLFALSFTSHTRDNIKFFPLSHLLFLSVHLLSSLLVNLASPSSLLGICALRNYLSPIIISHIARLGVRHESLLLLLSTVQLAQSSVCPLSNRTIPLIRTQAHHIYRFLCLSVIVHLSEPSSHSKRETPRRISYHSLKSCRI